MAWITEDRRTSTTEKPEKPYLFDEMKKYLTDVYFPRYPTRRAVLLPSLHLIQHTYNYIPQEALLELSAFLDIAPAEILDTATFYEEYWLKPKGEYLIQVCRSLACEICSSSKLTSHLRTKFGIDLGETTADGRFTLVELECLGTCGTAPVALINEVLHENLTVESIGQLIDKLPKDPHDYKDPAINWEQPAGH